VQLQLNKKQAVSGFASDVKNAPRYFLLFLEIEGFLPQPEASVPQPVEGSRASVRLGLPEISKSAYIRV